MKVLVTGATGLVGRRLVLHLEASGHQVIHLSRGGDGGPGSNKIGVDLSKAACTDARLRDVEAVVNLMGESIFGLRWTAKKKTAIYESRIVGTRNLLKSLQASGAHPRVMLSTSAVGYYGDAGGRELAENETSGSDFLAGVCRDWEAEAQKATELFPGIRVVIARFGVVLSEKGGMLEKLRAPFRLGGGSVLGSGGQWMSWIHEADLTEVLITLLQNDTYAGPVNAVAPVPVTNETFTHELARALGSVAFLKAPAFALRAGMGEMADMLLFSQRAVPRALESRGFVFRHPEVRGALEAVNGK